MHVGGLGLFLVLHDLWCTGLTVTLGTKTTEKRNLCPLVVLHFLMFPSVTVSFFTGFINSICFSPGLVHVSAACLIPRGQTPTVPIPMFASPFRVSKQVPGSLQQHPVTEIPGQLAFQLRPGEVLQMVGSWSNCLMKPSSQQEGAKNLQTTSHEQRQSRWNLVLP